MDENKKGGSTGEDGVRLKRWNKEEKFRKIGKVKGREGRMGEGKGRFRKMEAGKHGGSVEI